MRVFLSLLALAVGCAHPRPPAPAPVLSPQDAALGLADDRAAFDSERLTRRLHRRTHSVERQGNDATLLVNGSASFARRLQSVQDADVILVKTFIFADDEVGREVARRLAERARAGALVIVQYDFIGSVEGAADFLGAVGEDDASVVKPVLQPVVDAGGLVIPTNAPGSKRRLRRWLRTRAASDRVGDDFKSLVRFRFMGGFRHFDHEKYWITGHHDAQGRLVYEAIMGGMNIASEYAYGGTQRVDSTSGRGGWRDTDVALRGPVLRDIVWRYLQVGAFNRPGLLDEIEVERWLSEQPLAGSARVRFVWNQPAIGNRGKIERLYRTLIRATPAESLIRLESAYFTPGRRLRQPLTAALRRGARVAVVTNSRQSTDLGLVSVASRGAYELLLRVDPTAALYEWRPDSARGQHTLHSKVASFGRFGPVIIGSANLDGLSAEHNTESVVLVYDEALRQEFDAMLDDDIAASDRVSADELERASWLTRLWRRQVLRVGWYWLSR